MKYPPWTTESLRRSNKIQVHSLIAPVPDRSETRAVARTPEAPPHCATSASAFTPVAAAAKGGNLDGLALW
jgi:hypothetical protein